jgi:hypothetical protein
MDELRHIRTILEKFYQGSSNEKEEMELKEFFQREKIPEEFKADGELFSSFASINEDVDVPGDLNQKLISLIDNAQHKEQRSRRINLYSFSGLAAGLLIIISVYLGFLREDKSTVIIEQYAVEDPEVAYLEARKALNLVAEKWNQGTSELNNLGQVNKGIETISTINKISSGSKELNLLGNLRKANEIQL